jgi:alkyldihydroxyacetonephosphate synthase
VRGLRGRFPHPPDAVARPGDEAELALVLEWCAGERLAVVPYGGGTSVVGGVDAVPDRPRRRGQRRPRPDGSRARGRPRLARRAHPGRRERAALEQQLGDLTMRFYPQSFELSTLGGWIATRAAGHFATGPTHVDDLVESVRALTVTGEVWESRRLPHRAPARRRTGCCSAPRARWP